MKIYNSKVELIINTPATQGKAIAPNYKKLLTEAGIPIDEVLNKKAPLPRSAKAVIAKNAKTNGRLYVKTGIMDSEMNPWDVAHQSAKAFGPATTFIEPDLLKEFVIDTNAAAAYKKQTGNIPDKSKDDAGFDPDWQPHQNLVWHLDDQFSQLKSARDAVAALTPVIRIGHLDTGYSATHTIIPDSLRTNNLQRNFVDGEDKMDAHDRQVSGPLRMPLHGTGTGALLAGNKIKLKTDNGIFDDYLGGIPFAEVIDCRISNSVVLFKTSAFAEAVQYLVDLINAGTPIHVISMSMGGAPSRAWADAVNNAYEAGIVMVTASGNNFNGLPTSHVIYPARFKRVIAACGVTYDLRPYSSKKLGEMQGCFGPEKHMTQALAAFTPNTPWASVSDNLVKFSGAGTSSATPQIAAAAAIYYRKYYDELMQLEPWQRVEAIRNALYQSASQQGEPVKSFQFSFGNGILKAMDALQIPVNANLGKMPEDSIPWFPILSTIFKAVPGRQGGNKMAMYNTEIAQLIYTYPELAKLIGNDELSYSDVSDKQWRMFRDALIDHVATSNALKQFLINKHSPSK
jgi:subtilisin family serine protease